MRAIHTASFVAGQGALQRTLMLSFYTTTAIASGAMVYAIGVTTSATT